MEPEQSFLLCFGNAEAAARVALYGLPVALFLVGLAGSLMHCLGMCGPFVLGQVATGISTEPVAGAAQHYGELRRLREGALLPYHLGRLISYSALGAAAGSLGALLFALPYLKSLAAALLVLASLALIVQILPKLAIILPAHRLLAPLADWLARRVSSASLSARPGFFPLFRLGLLLGFLPCGFLWGGLAAAAASGNVVHGAMAMAGFGLGTMPALVGLGWGGALFGRRCRHRLALAALPLQGLNAAFLLWMSARILNGL